MTDEQIIKALECCGNIVDSTCKECAYHETYNASCVVRLMRDALDLYNRQKAEIERLQKIILGFMDEVGTWSNKYDVDISNIHKLPLLAKEDYNIKTKIKSEAIKEYREKVKAILMDKGIYPVVVKNALNEAEKEMVGDADV